MTATAHLFAADHAASPAVAWLLLVIVGYAAVALPALWWLLARLGRRTHAWAAVPALAALTALGLWFLGGPT